MTVTVVTMFCLITFTVLKDCPLTVDTYCLFTYCSMQRNKQLFIYNSTLVSDDGPSVQHKIQDQSEANQPASATSLMTPRTRWQTTRVCLPVNRIYKS